MIPLQFFAIFDKFERIVCINGSPIFFWVQALSEDCSSSPELIWFCMDVHLNPLSRQVLHSHCYICNAFSNLVLLCEPCGLLLSYRQIVQAILILSAAIVWISSANFRASAYFAIRVFQKMSE